MFNRLLIIIVVFFTVGLHVVFAQSKRDKNRTTVKDRPLKISSGKRPGQVFRDAKLRSSLNLSDEQRSQIQEILVYAGEKIRSIQKNAEDGIKSINEGVNNDIRSVLTSEQQEKWESYLDKTKSIPEFQSSLPGGREQSITGEDEVALEEEVIEDESVE